MIDDVKGDWTLDSINGQSLADYAAANGTDESLLFVNWTINDDNTITTENAVSSGTLKMELKSNGFEVKDEKAADSLMSVEFDKDAGTLTYKVEAAGESSTCVMKKGTFTPSEAESDEAEESYDEESEDESYDEGSLDEGSYDEESYDEEGYEEEDYEEEAE